MNQRLAHIALLVNNYDEAIAFYTQKLKFTVTEDTPLQESKRWVLLSPPGLGSCQLLLARAATEEQSMRIGNQTGGRVFLFLFTDDFYRDFKQMQSVGIVFIREPSVESYGTVAVFQDLYGNLWDLIQPSIT